MAIGPATIGMSQAGEPHDFAAASASTTPSTATVFRAESGAGEVDLLGDELLDARPRAGGVVVDRCATAGVLVRGDREPRWRSSAPSCPRR